ncbi:MAG: amino acid ABC transporter permease [Deltaproteobacteria bacterium]|nr:amino acid ABC transporter permease [Deltaproteobacteria bacterium]MBW2657992.1 amino acid ABC transporter permease [Deltaproteobacteria bacterium]
MKKKSCLTLTDLLVGTFLLIVILFFAYRVKVGLNYNWAWDSIPQFLFRYDNEKQQWMSGILMTGFYTTIRLSFWGIILATFFGVVTGIAKTSNVLFLKWLATTYVETMRNLPPLVIIFIAYFFVGDQILSPLEIDSWAETLSPQKQLILSTLFAKPGYLTSFFAALMTLAIFEGAYITEIVRAGIESIATGQWEASHALGLTGYQQMRHIILPQTFQRIMPPMTGQFISLIKDSSIVSVISIQELCFQGIELMTSTLHTIEIWTVITLMYLALTLPCSLLVERLEVRMTQGMR